MNYIVLDLEWNQSYPGGGKGGDGKVRNEIIEFGAVKLDENMNRTGTFKRLVRPVYIRQLNSRVKKITGITAKMLRDGGFFPDVVREFRLWCGDYRCILTWGNEDVPMLKDCLKMYSLPSGWVGKWYNLQVIFNLQTDGGKNQRSLMSALEHFGLSMDEEHPWHDALNDAIYTSMICQKLDIEKGIENYPAQVGKKKRKTDVSALTGLRPLVGTEHVYRRSEGGVLSCADAFELLPCPKCGRLMTGGLWIKLPRRRQASIAHCHEHGKFVVIIRTAERRGKTVASRTLYRCTPSAESAYLARLPVENGVE